MPEGQFQNKVGFSQESTFGTAIIDGGAFIQIDADIPQPDYGLFQDSRMTNRGSRVMETGDDFETQAGGIRTITINNWRVRRLDLAEIIYAVMQNVVEGATEPFTKVSTWQGSGGTPTTQPDFSANAGYFMTIGINESYTGAYDQKFISCIANKVTLNWNIASGEEGRLIANVDYISGFSAGVTSTFSGTWATNPNNYYYMNSPSVLKLGGSDIKLINGEIVFNNNAVRIGHNATGACIDYTLGPYEVTGRLLCLLEASTVGILADYLAGTTKSIQIATGTSGQAGHFDMTIPAAKYTGAPKDLGRAEGQCFDLAFRAEHNGTNPIITVTISDNFDQTW